MFPKKNRLKKKEFDQVFKIGKIFSNEYLLCKYSKGPNLSVAVVVPKKILKSAVKRNLTKRRINAILREGCASIPKGSIIFVVRKNPLDLERNVLKKIIFDILNKIV